MSVIKVFIMLSIWIIFLTPLRLRKKHLKIINGRPTYWSSQLMLWTYIKRILMYIIRLYEMYKLIIIWREKKSWAKVIWNIFWGRKYMNYKYLLKHMKEFHIQSIHRSWLVNRISFLKENCTQKSLLNGKRWKYAYRKKAILLFIL